MATKRLHEALRDKLRMWPTLLAALPLLAIVYIVAPQQLGILIYKACALTLGSYIGYWADRWSFPNDRIDADEAVGDDQVADNQIHAQYRRAAIVCATVLAFAFAA